MIVNNVNYNIVPNATQKDTFLVIVLKGIVMCVGINLTLQTLVHRERHKKRMRGEPFCASGISPNFWQSVPAINAKIFNHNVKCLVDSGCSHSIVSESLVRLLNLKTSQCNQNVYLMNGSASNCESSCVVPINVFNRVINLHCLVSNLLFDYDFLLGFECIKMLGGVKFDVNGNVTLSVHDTAAVVFSLTLDDPDFTAKFDDGRWTVKWRWRDEAPRLKNSVSQYKMKSSVLDAYETEIQDWIEKGWLEKYYGDHDGIIPLMAVIQSNKGKVRPVMDYRELNQFVSSHTAESEICSEKLRSWRKLGNNLAIIDLRKAYLQISVDPDLYKYQVVVFKGKKYCLTRLGFGLNCAPRIMTQILKKVFSMDSEISAAVDSYIDDIIVNKDKVSCEKVLDLLNRYGLEAKPPEDIVGARILGLKVENRNGCLYWKRDNIVQAVDSVRTKRQLFSYCGQLLGHYPVARWLRPACSYIKRQTNGCLWDDSLSSFTIALLRELKERLEKEDPVGGAWSVSTNKTVTVWCDASSLATGVALELDGKRIEDSCWLRKEDDSAHINVAELEAVLKGINLAISWGFKSINICSDSSSVFGWLKSLSEKDRPRKPRGISSVLINRCLQLLDDLIKETNITVSVKLVPSSLNLADAMTRVPSRWLHWAKETVAVSVVDNSDFIREVHDKYHQGVKKLFTSVVDEIRTRMLLKKKLKRS